MKIPFQARLTGMDAQGRKFKEATVLDDLSVGGLLLRLTRNVPAGSEVTVAVRLSTAVRQGFALRLAARGKVLRTEPQPDGTYRLAVQFDRRRVL